MTSRLNQEDVSRSHPGIILHPSKAIQHTQREANIERHRIVNLIHLLIRKLEFQRIDVILEMLRVAASDDGEDVRVLVHHVRQSHAGQDSLLLARDLLQRGGDLAVVLTRVAHLPAACLLLLELGGGAVVAPAEGAPGRDAHALRLAHGQDVALEVARAGVPQALVDAELRQAVVARVLVRLADDPGRGVADAEVEHFARCDDVVQRLHEFRDGGRGVPPVQVQHVDVVRLQLFQARVQRHFQTLPVVALVVGLHRLDCPIGVWVACGELRGQHDLVPVASLLHPLADPDL